MSRPKRESIEAIRRRVHSALANMTRDEAEALRALFGITSEKSDKGDVTKLRALIEELAARKKQSKK